MTTESQIITPPAPRETSSDEDQSLAPAEGEAVPTSEVRTQFLPDDASTNAGERWQRIQAEFVDDPRRSVGEAHELVGELMRASSRPLRANAMRWSASGRRATTCRPKTFASVSSVTAASLLGSCLR